MSEENDSTLERILSEYMPNETNPPNILRCLLAVQQCYGYIPLTLIPRISEVLGVPKAEVSGVFSYFPGLRQDPAGHSVVRVCMGESCLANHGERLLAAIREELKINPGETTKDGNYTLEIVYCVGNCGVSPTVLVNDHVHGRVKSSEVTLLLRGLP